MDPAGALYDCLLRFPVATSTQRFKVCRRTRLAIIYFATHLANPEYVTEKSARTTMQVKFAPDPDCSTR
jgi:hypothetical protein